MYKKMFKKCVNSVYVYANNNKLDNNLWKRTG